MGSKNRLSKHIKPIIQNFVDNSKGKYIEPFVGGANMIDKIECESKIGVDNNQYLISLLTYVQEYGIGDFPTIITREHYNEVRDSYNKEDGKFPLSYIGYIGFMASYNGRFFDGGYSGHEVKEKGKDKPRDFIGQTITNFKNQINNLSDIEFIYSDYRELSNHVLLDGFVIYCDPPYKGTKKYNTSKDFDYEAFYDWCREMSKNNIVIVSEYNMPEDFECIWKKETKTNMMDTNNGKRKTNVEKLFILGEVPK